MFLSYGILTFISASILIMKRDEPEKSYDYTIGVMTALLGILFVDLSVDLFTTIKFPSWIIRLRYVLSGLLVLEILIMII